VKVTDARRRLEMTLWFHSTILATSVAATLAVGIASAAILVDSQDAAAPKADRLPAVVGAADASYVTVETRADGTSILAKVPVN
jgi:hypothetical protein